MTDLSKLTAKDFSDAMHKGWKGIWLGYCKKQFRREIGPIITNVCAVGAMSRGLGISALDILGALDGLSVGSRVIDASDRAGNKRAAMKAVDAILLNTPAVRAGE